MKQCPECRGYLYTSVPHTCLPSYAVHFPEYGDEIQVRASDAKEAAEKAVDRWDAEGDYVCVRGEETLVEVFAPGEGPSAEGMQRDVWGWMGYHIGVYPYNPKYNCLMDANEKPVGGCSEMECLLWEDAPDILTESGAAQLLTFLFAQGFNVRFHASLQCCNINSDTGMSAGDGDTWPTALLRAAYSLCPGEFKEGEGVTG